MKYVIWILLGLGSGGVLLVYARSKGRQSEKRILAIALVIVAAVYVGFALVWGNTRWILIEIAGVPVFSIFAGLALRHSVNWLTIGWALHPAWDAGLHLLGPGHAIVPVWYAVACIPFDLLVAAYLLASGFRSERSTG